jgi:tetratricopeptide (TPR) repeat protein
MNIGFDCERRVFPRLPTWLLAWTSVFAGVSATGAAAEPPPAVQLPQESAGPQPAALTAAQRAEKLGEEIWIVGTDGAKPHKLCDGGFPTWSSDGKRVFFHSRQQKQILVVDSSDLQQLLSPVEAEAKIDRPAAAGAAAKVITSPEQAASADRAGSLNNLANRYARKGDFARAEPLFREAAEIFRRSLGENHPRYALALNNLGNLYKKRGDYAQAESQFRKAIAVWEKLPGEYYPCHPVCLNNLGSLCEEKGDDAQAELLFRRALAIQEKGHGEDQPSYATSLDNLGCLYKGQGDYARAEPLLRQALAVRERAVGKNDTD